MDEAAVEATVQTCLACLSPGGPGLACPLAQRLITAVEPGAPHYIGVLHTLTEDSQVWDLVKVTESTRDLLYVSKHMQDPNLLVKSDLARFLFNFLALRLSIGPANLASGKCICD